MFLIEKKKSSYQLFSIGEREKNDVMIHTKNHM